MNSPEKIHPENSDDRSARTGNGGSSATGGNAEIHDRTGLYISILALAFAGIAIGSWLNQGQMVDAKIQAAVAKAEARAETAETHARVALDKVEDFRAKLAEKGVNINLDGH